MPKARVYELAKELGVDSKTVLSKLEAMGEFVKSASSTVEPPVARKLRNAFASSGQGNASDSRSRAIRPRSLPNRHLIPCQSRPLRQHRSRLPRSAEAASCRFKSDAPKPGHRAPRPGESRQHGNRPNGNAPRPQGGDRRQSGRPTAVPGARPSMATPAGWQQRQRREAAHPGTAPGQQSVQPQAGHAHPTPGDIPRPHPMNRPSVNNGEGRRGGVRVRAAASVAASVVVGSGRREAGPVGPASSGQGGGQRPAGGGNRFGGNGGGFQGGNSAPSNGPARGGRGRGARRVPDVREASPRRRVRTVWRSVRNSGDEGSGHRRRAHSDRQRTGSPSASGCVPRRSGRKINVNPAALVTVLFHLGEMATAPSPWMRPRFRSSARKSAGTSRSCPPKEGRQGAAAAVRHQPGRRGTAGGRGFEAASAGRHSHGPCRPR